jgi:hypothetical protein
VVVSIAWKDNPHHPGEYEVQVCIPVHNSVGPVVFQTVRGYPPNMTMSYEQLEGFFLDFATAHGKLRAVEKHPELALVSWEIFLYTHDKQLTQSVSQNLRTAIETSLDFDLPIDERYYAYIEATNALIVEQPVIFNRYEHFIHIHTKRSLGWLARLVRGVFLRKHPFSF